jgi:iron complex outermembrane receptor protein
MTTRWSSRPGSRPTPLLLLASTCLASLLAMTGTPPQAAEDESDKEPERPIHAGTETVEVTGEGGIAGDAPTSFVTVIRPREHTGAMVTLADLLSAGAGVRVRSYGGLNSFATVSIRGSTAEQVIVLVDGVSLNSPLGGAVNLADIPLSGVESIEVHRGFTPATLGRSSIGGAVNIRTTRSSEASGLHGSLAHGSYGTSRATALAATRTGPMRWVISGEAFTTQGDFTYLDNNATLLTGDDNGFQKRRNNDGWSAALRVRGESEPAPGRKLTLSGEWLRRRQGVPGIDAFQSETAGFSLQRGLLRGEHSWTGLAEDRVTFTAGADLEYTSESFSDSGDQGVVIPQNSTTRLQGAGGRLALEADPGPAHHLTLLLEPRAEAASTFDRVNPVADPIHAHRATLAVVAEDEIRLASSRLLLAPSLRYDAARTSSRGGSPGGVSEPAHDPASLSGRMGVLWIPSPRWTLRGNVGRFYRIPGLLELYGNEGTLVGNPSLRAEEGLNADLGLSFHGGKAGPVDDLFLEVSAFQTAAEDLIRLVPLPTRVVKAFNIGQARITGLEGTVSFRLLRRIGLSANVTLQKPEDRSDTFNRGRDLPGTPRREAATSASLDLGRTTLFHRFTYVGENEIGMLGPAATNLPPSRRELTRLPSRYLHDGGIRLRLTGHFAATVEVLNIFDRHVVDVARYPLPGRSVFVKLAGSF